MCHSNRAVLYITLMEQSLGLIIMCTATGKYDKQLQHVP